MNLTLNIFDESNSPIVISIGDISINGDSNIAPSSTHTAVVPNGTSAILSVSLSGYHSYTMVIDTVYNADKTINVTLVPILNINNANYNRPYPSFTTFLDPCSFRVDFYSTTSQVGNQSWYVGNQLYLIDQSKGSLNTTAPTDFQLKLREETYDGYDKIWDRMFATTMEGNTVKGVYDPVDIYLALDTTTNVETLEYRPDFITTLSSPVELELDNHTYYTRGEIVTGITDFTPRRTGTSTSDYTITYKVINPLGVEIINVTLPGNLISPLEFELVELGVYTIFTTVTDIACNNTFTKTNEVETYNFVDIKYKECDTFELFNRSSATDISIDVQDLNNVSVLQTNVQRDSSVIIPLQEVSLYVVNVNYNRNNVEVNEQYLINNYCQLEDCISDYIENLLCGKEPFCSPCPDDVTLNQIMLLMYTFSAKIHSIFTFNNFYTLLEDSDFSKFISVKNIGDKLKEFCDRRCISSTTSAFSTTKNAKYDYRTTNKDCNCS